MACLGALPDDRVVLRVFHGELRGHFGKVPLKGHLDAAAELLMRGHHAAGKRGCVRLPAECGIRLTDADRRVEFARHCRRVSLDEGKEIRQPARTDEIEMPLSGLFENCPCFVELVNRKQRRGKISVRRDEFGIETDGLAKRRDRLLEATESDECGSNTVERECLSRIRRSPRLRKLEGFLPVLDGIAVVTPRNKEPFAFADPVPQLECSSRIGRSQRRLTGVGVHARQERVSHCERWIELNRPLELRNGLESRHFDAFGECERISVERVERCGCGSRQRHIELLNRRERFAQLLAHSRCGGAQ